MKALFIVHCQDPIYGASRSVGNLIRNLDADVDLIFPVKIKRDGITPGQIRKFYGPRVGKVWFLPQPARLTCIALAGISPVHYVKSAVKDVLYLLAKPVYRRIFAEGNYDVIHLNSITLYPMLQREWPMFLHVRETVPQKRSAWDRKMKQYMERAHGIIAIGPRQKESCPQADVPWLVLVNPFDQTGVGQVDVNEARRRFGLTGDETVYSIIGDFFPEKGIGFVVGAFKRAALENAVLLIVGRDVTQEGFEAEIRRQIGGDARIRMTGEVEDVEAVYRVTDYVVRGDTVAAAGRTVFESLYSGGGVILQGERERDLPGMRLTGDMEQRVHFYPVRDESGLVDAFRRTEKTRFLQREYRSNVEAYVQAFTEFVEAHRKGEPER